MTPKTKKIIAIITIIVGALAWIYVIVRVYEIRNQRQFAWRNYLMTHRRRPVSSSDISYIAPWMTFDYITRVFDLPPTYLDQNLKVSNPKYPAITLMQYAKTTGTSTGAVIRNVQDLLKKYLASSTPQ